MNTLETVDRHSIASLMPSAIRPGRPTITTTYQLAAELPLHSDGNMDETWIHAIKVILLWLKDKWPESIPSAAWEGQDIHEELAGQRLDCVVVPDDGVWSARLEQPDSPFMDRPAVPGRIWFTDLALRKRHGFLGFGVRVQCSSLPYSQEEIRLIRPRVVKDLTRKMGLRQIVPMVFHPRQMRSESDLDALYDLLVNPERQMPVIMLTQPDVRRLGQPCVSEYLLDADRLARELIGYAHVVKMPHDLGFRWTERVSKPWSAFLGAVRTYHPGLDFDEDTPRRHPLTFAENILFWRMDGEQGERAFEDFLIEQTSEAAASRSMIWNDLLFHVNARALAASRFADSLRERLDSGRTSDQGRIETLEQLLEAEKARTEAVQQKLAEAEREAEEWSDASVEADQAREYYRQQNERLRCKVHALFAQLEAKTQESPDDEIEFPCNYDDLPDWVDDNLAGRLVLCPRAIRSVKDAVYNDVELVYRSLILLARNYRDMRLTQGSGISAFDDACSQLGVCCGRSIDESRAGEFGEIYYVRWPVGSHRRQFLSHHIRKGSIKDDRLCMAIYFFWDAESQQVVVGSLPKHLDNRMT